MCVSDIEYDPLGDLKSSFDFEAEILNLLFLFDFLIFFYV